ncbi:hypothetical protein LF1_23980 [Rubripirellula obstinata]|uniref:GEVED domain-containing protein n=1 Tax=Rubripirellula obstinata TaxID=406547 RepID=A0A5B1CI04_9BACT|nr:GEVED domain-containing protein [Rubripirellula obstinata]KAA1259861.1 hypothetical protein LF1_23980 [Rubripirellula obstinata]
MAKKYSTIERLAGLVYRKANRRNRAGIRAGIRTSASGRRGLRLESLEKRQLLAASVIAPVDVELQSVEDSYLQYGTNQNDGNGGSHWYNGSGLTDASIVETGDPIPAAWPEHVSGNHRNRVSRIRDAAEFNTLTFDLGGTFDVSGMVLWNSTEDGQSDRGFENTVLSYSTDGGLTFTGSDALTWTQRIDDEPANANPSTTFGPEVEMLPAVVAGVTHVRMVVDNFSPGGSDKIVMASELRFIGDETPSPVIVVAPVRVELTSVNDSFLQDGSANANWYNGSGLSDASIVETGDSIPEVWPTHAAGHDVERVTRIRNANEFNTLTFDLGERLDLIGMVLWNGSEPNRPTRGIENTVLSYSTDGGLTFSGSDTLTWMNRSEATVNPNGHLPEVQMLDAPIRDVTHVRMVVDNFSDNGSDRIVAADEIRFLGQGRSVPTVANLAGRTVNDQFDRRQGIEGSRALDLTVTLSSRNFSGAPISFDLEDLGTGTATVGLDYQPIPAGAKITVPVGAISGSFRVDVFDDALIEPTETLNARISNSSNSSSVIGQATTTATIRDNDVAGITLIGADNLQVSESGQTDSYTVQLDTIPTGAVEITATADSETEISTDGVNFAATQILTLTDTAPQTITVRAVDDLVIEDTHQATITHAITGTVVDPNYPDVKVEDLYTQTGDDPLTFQDLLDSGALPRGFNSNGGVLGSAIDVNNAAFEQGVNAGIPIPQNIRLHTLGHSQLLRPDFDNWTRWYQEDGNTQIYRLFEGEENTHSDRLLAARTETHTTGDFSHGVWNEFSASYMIMKPETMSIFQSFQGGFQWSVHIGMDADGSVNMTHRRVGDDIHVKVPLGVDMIGKRFDVLIRDDGFNYQVYFNGELMGTGFWQRDPTSRFSFRWGPYVGEKPVTRDTMLFVTGVTMRADAADPIGLVPYRPATTALSIADASAEITDNDDDTQLDFGDAPFLTLLSDDGARHFAGGPQLGSSRDVESDGSPSPNADGDGDDEDGVMFGGINVNGSMAAVNIELPENNEGFIDAWIDFNGNRVWEASEKILDRVFVDQSMQTLNYDLPIVMTTGDTYARVRLSSAGGLGPTGLAADGEVEDYRVSIVDPPQVESIVVNEGSSQRSSLDSIRVTFDGSVVINQTDGDPFQITQAGSTGSLTPLAFIRQVNDKTVVDLTFAAGDSYVNNFGSLLDGDYQLKIDASLVTYQGVELDGNRDGSAGDDYEMSATDGLFRKYGDADGDDSVGLSDFATFRSVFGTSSNNAADLSGLDSDGDGDIGLTDFAAFRANFGR